MADRLTSLYAQVAIFVIGLCMAAFAPPANGAMLVVPLHAGSGSAINLALAHGATLLGAGPFPGSFIVRGDRDTLLPLMLRQGILVTAAAPLICGALPGSIEKQL